MALPSPSSQHPTQAQPRPRRAVLYALALGLCALATAAAAQPSEYEVKAEFLERFTRFVDWPPESDGETAFVIGVVGRDPFGTYLDALGTRSIKGRKVTVRRFAGPDEVGGCHLLFISASEGKRLAEVLARTRKQPVLTVGDSPGYAQAGVLINLVSEGDRLGFEINEGAVRDSGLRFSSKLLKLARVVEEGRRP